MSSLVTLGEGNGPVFGLLLNETNVNYVQDGFILTCLKIAWRMSGVSNTVQQNCAFWNYRKAKISYIKKFVLQGLKAV